MSFNYFKNGFGIVTENDPVTENCNLFLAQYHILKRSYLTQEDKDFFINNMKLKINERGVYNRRSIEPKPTREMSQDEILGFLISSKLLKTDHGKEIWNHLVWHWGSYNNTGRLFDYLPFNPGNAYSWGQIVGSSLSYLFLPIYIINMLITINKEPANTSSKIMFWMEFSVMPKTWINKILYKIYRNKMVKQYGEVFVSVLLHKYHNRESLTEFPIFKEL